MPEIPIEVTYLAIAALLIALMLVLRALFGVRQQNDDLRQRYGDIIDVEQERDRVAREKEALASEVTTRRASWERDFGEALRELEVLTRRLDAARDQAELQSFGVYEPHYDFESSAAFKAKLDEIRGRQKTMVREKEAAVCETEWHVGDSKAKGRQMTDRYLKLQLRAFNGECDAAVVKVRYNNVTALAQRINRAFETLNKLGESLHCAISSRYLDLRISELRLAHEYQEKREAEKEEQRRIREQMREEERVRREIEKARKDAEKEEQRYADALQKARRELESAGDQKRAELQGEIDSLQAQLDEAHASKERAVSRAQLTKSGHVYIVSNIGSFGENVYKIGLTRRLDPDDRIRELGDASVPFPFDVHAMIYSEDAPSLEQKLHHAFDVRRVNLVNMRKEFFAVSISEIEEAAQGDGSVTFTLAAEAEEYRKTLALREAREAEPEALEVEAAVADARTRLEQRRASWAGERDQTEA